MKLIVSKGCGPCNRVKPLMPPNTMILDIESLDGMTEAAFHDITVVPALIDDNDNLHIGADAIVMFLE